jgi:hypothetical protein
MALEKLMAFLMALGRLMALETPRPWATAPTVAAS